MQVPRSRQIRNVYKSLIKELREAVREANQAAATALQKGRYEQAQRIIGLSQRLNAYVGDVRELKGRFGGLRGGTATPKAKGTSHKLWEYYVPITQCLAALGKDATREEIEQQFITDFGNWLLPGDHRLLPKGDPYWKICIRRSKKHLVTEGLVESPKPKLWRLTPLGKKAADSRKNVGTENK